MGMGTIFRLGEQIGEKQSRQSNSKYNFLPYIPFLKMVYTVYNRVSGKAPSSWGVFVNFGLQVDCKVTFDCKLQKQIGGAGCITRSPNNFVEGAAPVVGSSC